VSPRQGLFVLLLIPLLGGCATFENAATKAMNMAEATAIVAIEKLEPYAAQMTADMKAINPGYRVRFEGFYVQGFKGHVWLDIPGTAMGMEYSAQQVRPEMMGAFETEIEELKARLAAAETGAVTETEREAGETPTEGGEVPIGPPPP